MTQTLYFITQNGQPISMETWTDREAAFRWAQILNDEHPSAKFEVHSRVSSDNASEATPITVTMGIPGATGAAKDDK